MENWKAIKFEEYDFSDTYEVSDNGNVRNIKTGRLLKPQKTNSGYLQLMLQKNGIKKHFYIHRLVAYMFLPMIDGKSEVNHKNEIKTDNHVSNLEWCDRSYNMNHSHLGAKRTDECKQKMSEKSWRRRNVLCVETGEIFNSVKEAEVWCGKKGVSGCCNGKQQTAGGYHWKFYEKE